MNIHKLEFEKCYAGIFITNTGEEFTLVDLEIPHVSFWIFKSDNQLICFGIGDEHTESITKWLQLMDNRIAGSSLIVGIIKKDLVLQKIGDYFSLLRINIKSLNEKEYTLLRNFSPQICLYEPTSFDLFILTNPYNLEKLDSDVSKRIETTAKLKLIETFGSFIENESSKKKYDPIGAQITEVLEREVVEVSAQIRGTASLWQRVFEEDPPIVFDQMYKGLEHKQEELGKLTNTNIHVNHGVQNILKLIDTFSQTITIVSKECNELTQILQHYLPPPDPWSTSSPYFEQSSRLILKAANNYMNDLVERTYFSDQLISLVTFGDYFQLLEYFQVSKFLLDIHSPDKSITLFSIPRKLRLRLGALPVLAHALGEVINNYNDSLQQYILKNWHIQNIIGMTLNSLGNNQRNTLYLTDINIDEIINNWTSKISSDLIATALAGPSYIYSIARFATGTLGESFVGKEISHAHPPLPTRISFCLELLRPIGIESSFKSVYQIHQKDYVDNEIVSIVHSIVSKPYTIEEHEEIQDIQSNLRAGCPSASSPVLILNALWDAVEKRSGYLNEIALLISLLRGDRSLLSDM